MNKLSGPVTILTASIILGGFYYATEMNKQRSIERQQEINLTEEKTIAEGVANQEKQRRRDKELKDESTKREMENKVIVNSNLLDACLADARSSYDNNWAVACSVDAKRKEAGLKNCINVVNPNWGPGTPYYQALVDGCNSVWGKPDFSGNCPLPHSNSETINKYFSDAKSECFKRYPQL